MNILITGASGLVGTALSKHLSAAGHTVIPLLRGTHDNASHWDPNTGTIHIAQEGIDAVIHFAGDNVGKGRWTATKKARILDSRIQGTRLIAEHFSQAEQKPKVIISASAIGYYGNTGDTETDEQGTKGAGFLADVCQAWEDNIIPAKDAGIRVVNARIGIVLSNQGGALSEMIKPIKLGLGGRLGSGQQFMSWIHIADLCKAFEHCLENEAIQGPTNFVSPTPIRNADFIQSLASTLNRPAIFPAPAWALRLAVGQMADEALLSSSRVIPQTLIKDGFKFEHTNLKDALQALF